MEWFHWGASARVQKGGCKMLWWWKYPVKRLGRLGLGKLGKTEI
jgi:hypothetical protein